MGEGGLCPIDRVREEVEEMRKERKEKREEIGE